MQLFDRGPRPLAGEQTLGQFALVAYIPDPLAGYLDDLRRELTPNCNPHAHVTILPPRPIHDDLKETVEQITNDISGVPAFWAELSEIAVFPESNVIYLALSQGTGQLRQLYQLLNCGCLQYTETFPYHPHITIVQNPLPDEVQRMADLARERWAAYSGPRGFMVSVLSFVQNVAPSIWADVAALALGAGAAGATQGASRDFPE
jgi:2'-5' RNA ligase